MIERTLIILKPGCLQRGIAGEIISRFEKKGFKIVAMKMVKITKEKAEEHYHEHIGKDFFQSLVDYITLSPVVLMVLEGDNAIMLARKLTGITIVDNAEPGTIRGDYCMVTPKNLVHASDGPENAKREIELFFEKSEILDYKRSLDKWVSY